MMDSATTKKHILEQLRRYPAMQPTDLLKFLHQSTFGCGHLISSPSAASNYIRQEMAQCPRVKDELIELLDEEFCRVHLDYLRQTGLSADTFARLFALSASLRGEGTDSLMPRLDTALILADKGVFDFSVTELKAELEQWRAEGFPARHHSDAFRQAYSPAYRVLSRYHAQWLPLLAKLDQLIETNDHLMVAIEGGSASGKSTLAQLLSTLYDCNVFHMDDFFLRPEQRTAERLAQPGGNVDYERFAEQVLTPLSQRKTVSYQRFDCSTQTILPAVDIKPKAINFIEGAYSMHPLLSDAYDFSLFLRVAPDVQRQRIEKRNTPEMAARHFETWIPLEEHYFTATNAASRCSMIWEVNE